MSEIDVMGGHNAWGGQWDGEYWINDWIKSGNLLCHDLCRPEGGSCVPK